MRCRYCHCVIQYGADTAPWAWGTETTWRDQAGTTLCKVMGGHRPNLADVVADLLVIRSMWEPTRETAGQDPSLAPAEETG